MRIVESIAGDNKTELQRVLKHYRGQPKRHKAAVFLINNMGHAYRMSSLGEEYRRRVMNSDVTGVKALNEIWFSVKDSSTKEKVDLYYDARIMTADYLIKNIDEAFNVWENAPWHRQIDFDTFCRYILPYRVLSEPLSDWRTHLKQKYAYLIEGETDPARAFGILYRYLIKAFDTMSLKCPDTPDVILADRLMTGICSHRCVYIISVMRSLGIPASYDLIHYWANYSTSGHSWVAYVPSKYHTATMLPSDTIPLENNMIDASIFTAKNVPNRESFRFKVDTLKRVSKIFRQSYEMNNHLISPSDKSIPDFFKSPFITDVSDSYGQTSHSLTIKTPFSGYYFLCTFASIYDWQTAAMSKSCLGKVQFDNVGSGIVYLPAYYDGYGNLISVSNPFVLQDDNSIITLNPDTSQMQRVVLRRKYVLYAHWLKRWSKMIDARFEASDEPDFKESELLYQVSSIPEGITRISFKPSKKYRYIRVQVREDARPDIAEISFYSGENGSVPLEGQYIYEHIPKEEVEKATDGDYTTHGGSLEEHYWLGLDIGQNPQEITAVEFCMRHDMNMVVAGHEYELLYYDNTWKSLGRLTATCDSLVYEVPVNALFWLRDHTKGREERIFTYDNGRQEWW